MCNLAVATVTQDLCLVTHGQEGPPTTAAPGIETTVLAPVVSQKIRLDYTPWN